MNKKYFFLFLVFLLVLVSYNSVALEIINATQNMTTVHTGRNISFIIYFNDTIGKDVKILLDNNYNFTDCNFSIQTGCMLNTSNITSTGGNQIQILNYTAQLNSGTILWYVQICNEDNICDIAKENKYYRETYESSYTTSTFIKYYNYVRSWKPTTVYNSIGNSLSSYLSDLINNNSRIYFMLNLSNASFLKEGINTPIYSIEKANISLYLWSKPYSANGNSLYGDLHYSEHEYFNGAILTWNNQPAGTTYDTVDVNFTQNNLSSNFFNGASSRKFYTWDFSQNISISQDKICTLLIMANDENSFSGKWGDLSDKFDLVELRELFYDSISPFVNIKYLTIQDESFTESNNVPTFTKTLQNFKISHSTNLSYDVNCSDTDSDTIIYYDNSTLFNINSSTGIIFDNPLRNEVGNYRINITCSDGYLNTSQLMWYNITDSAPNTPTQTYPNHLAVISTAYAYLNWTTIDIDGDSIIYYVYASTSTNPSTLIYNGSLTYRNYSGLSDATTYYWKVKASDNVTNSSNSTIRSFSVSTTAPAINPINYLNNSWNNTNRTINISFTATDANGIDVCSLYINSTGWHKNQTKDVTSSVESGFTINLINDKKYYYNIWCNDTSGASGFYTYNLTLGIDMTEPSLTVSSPTSTTYNSETISLTLLASDTFLQRCYYYIYYKDTRILKTNNLSINCTGTTTLSTPYYSGGYMLRVYANDTAKNVNITEINFTTQVTTGGTIVTLGGGGGNIEEKGLICNESGQLWDIRTLYGKLSYTFIIPYKTVRPIEKELILTNYGSNNLSVTLNCERTDSSSVNICDYVTIPNETIIIPPNPQEAKTIMMSVYYPEGADNDQQFSFNIISSDNVACEFSLNNKAVINRFSLNKWKTLSLSKLNPDWGDVEYPVLLPAIIALLFWVIVGIIVTSSTKNAFLGIFVIGILLGLTSFGIVTFI